MVKKFPQIVSHDDIAFFRQDMAEKFAKGFEYDHHVPGSNSNNFADKDWIELRYGLKDWNLLDQRYVFLTEDEGYQRLQSIISTANSQSELDLQLDNNFAAYQRQYIPQPLHVDEFHYPPEKPLDQYYSVVIPLDPNPHNMFRTYVWNCPVHSNEEWKQNWARYQGAPMDRTPISNTAETCDVEHICCSDNDYYVTDLYELDGVYDYELGSIGVFSCCHLHCSNNWLKYNQVKHKDIIILHLT